MLRLPPHRLVDAESSLEISVHRSLAAHKESPATLLKARAADVLEHSRYSGEQLIGYAVLFPVLFLIYSIYLNGIVEPKHEGVIPFDLSFLFTIIKLTIFAGWPFGVIARLDSSWRSEDAARMAIASFMAASVLWLHRYHLHACGLGLTLLFAPAVFSALVFHSLGVRRRPWRPDPKWLE